MIDLYRFISDNEPTKEQLDELMLAVLDDVKKRATKAEEKYKAMQAQTLAQVQEVCRQKQKKNGLQ